MSKILLLAICIIVPCLTRSQDYLPLYEKQNDSEFLLIRVDTASAKKHPEFKTISILTQDGVNYTSFDFYRTITEEECCTHPNPIFLIGTLADHKVTKKKERRVYINGKVAGGQLFDETEVRKIENSHRWISEKWDTPLIQKYGESKKVYRWFYDSLNRDSQVYLQYRYAYDFGAGFTYITYHVHLSECMYYRRDSIEVMYATPDSAWRSEPSWMLMYVNGKLLEVTPDYSGTTSDGYGPFFYKPKKWIGWYRAGSTDYLLFDPGYIVFLNNEKWTFKNREPVRYYGECDCDE